MVTNYSCFTCKTWKNIVLNDEENPESLFIFGHQVARKYQIYRLNKLTSIAQKRSFLLIKDFFSKCDQIRRKLRI